jgi:hypothetical protein
MITTIIFVIVVCLAIAHILRYYTVVEEGFESPTDDIETPAADHPDMTPDETNDDPRDIPWIASWSPADNRARRGHNCNPTYTEIGPDGTMIYTTTKSCEDGMAHTRIGERIYIPDNISSTIRFDTIRHELIHVYQRRNPKSWAKFYQRNWSFVLATEPPHGLPKELIDARRSNPDTWDPAMGGAWSCWMGRWWPVSIYRDPVNPRLRDADTVFWDSWRRETFKEPPHGWTAFFGTPGQDEHPHEISATMIVSEDTKTEAGRRLMNWWNSTGSYQQDSGSELK